MNTKEIMDIALELAGLTQVPEDSDINVPGDEIRRVIAGIDIDSGEMYAAKNMGYDCVLRHHPRGFRMASVGDMEVRDHIAMMRKCGVPVNIAQKTAAPRGPRMNRHMHPNPLNNQPQFAEFIGMAYVSIHTPADLIFEHTLEQRMAALTAALGEEEVKLKDIMANLMEIPELSRTAVHPEIWIGDEESYAGKILVTMAGGGAPTVEEFLACINAGVGTIITMHIEDDVLEALEKDGRCSVIVTGHYPSDSYGINRILDELEKRGVETARIGGIVY